jgi:hypothetical protein
VPIEEEEEETCDKQPVTLTKYLWKTSVLELCADNYAALNEM